MIERRRGAILARRTPAEAPPSVVVLAGEPKSASLTREFVRAFVRHHAPDASEDHVETVVLVACEMVTNSIRYGTGPGDSLQLSLDTDDARTRVEVRDPVRRRPRPRPESQQRDRGRGLIILDALCREWGVVEAQFGKAVWAEVGAS
ncbi:ATP-binding protein [Streptomyces sp. PTM05]|uniref:ATP-binding protein n=1 Tax=Streptantibioticus parmotrematis TaxID=2873249 RepID=A0ABS7R1Y4_9ACTN|nr:ATP-binding protein [Streptantibioticus parmotrematis]MBY8888570.1 ATP-binding protein [Streptantibioticus parmotrematis]